MKVKHIIGNSFDHLFSDCTTACISDTEVSNACSLDDPPKQGHSCVICLGWLQMVFTDHDEAELLKLVSRHLVWALD